MRKTIGLLTLLLGLGACSNSVPPKNYARSSIEAAFQILDAETGKSESQPKQELPSTVYTAKEKLELQAKPKDNASSQLHPYGTLEGRYQRVSRWHSAIYETESRYGIPDGYLAGLAMQESLGDPLNLNDDGDGGAGLMMLQPGTARSLGLKVYDRSRATGRDLKHGAKLEALVKKHHSNLARLSEIDERFNPNKAVDAAGRLLLSFKERYGSWEKAVSAYRCGHPVRNLDSDDHVQNVLQFANYYLQRNNGVLHPGDFVLAYHSGQVQGYEYIVQAGDTLSEIKRRFEDNHRQSVLSIKDENKKVVGGRIHSNQHLYVESVPRAYAQKN